MPRLVRKEEKWIQWSSEEGEVVEWQAVEWRKSQNVEWQAVERRKSRNVEWQSGGVVQKPKCGVANALE